MISTSTLDRRTDPGAIAALAIPLVLGVAAWLIGWEGGDLPAQVFRVWLFEHQGFASWNPYWYGGHHTTGYSILFPPIASVFGVAITGIASAIVASWCFWSLASDRWGARARWGTIWFAVGTVANLVVGRMTFGLGLAIGLAAVLAARRRHVVAAAFLSVLCPMASPVAGAFLLLAWTAWLLSSERPARRTPLQLVLVTAAPLATISLVLSDGGSFPFRWTAAAVTVAVALVGGWLLPRRERVLRIGCWLYAAAALVAFLVPNALGANVQRLGMFVLGPVLVGACSSPTTAQRRTLMVLVPVLVWWGCSPALDGLFRAGRDPSTLATYYTGAVGYLAAHLEPGEIVEVVPTRRHWEAVFVAEAVPIARGWERQLDFRVNAVFYDQGLHLDELQEWLNTHRVGLVALPDAELDPSGWEEAELVRRVPPFLREVWGDDHWRIFEVIPA